MFCGVCGWPWRGRSGDRAAESGAAVMIAFMRVLLTNDDGIDAPGIRVMYEACRQIPGFDRVDVVSPAKVQSATSHAVTFHRPMRVEERTLPWGKGLAVEGRPADCVKLALSGVLHEAGAPPVDLVISGINAGGERGDQRAVQRGRWGAARGGDVRGGCRPWRCRCT